MTPRVACFFALLATLSLNGPLHDLSDYYLFSAHMVQHLLLTLVVPPLLLLGMPGWMADGLLAPLVRLGRAPDATGARPRHLYRGLVLAPAHRLRFGHAYPPGTSCST
jgi:putative membrane protein